MKILHDLSREHQTGVVIVSHDERLRAIADSVIYLEDGSIVPS